MEKCMYDVTSFLDDHPGNIKFFIFSYQLLVYLLVQNHP